MSIFFNAVTSLFSDPNIARDAVWRPGGVGDGVPVRVIAHRPDTEVAFGDIAVHTATAVFEVRVAEVPDPEAGDTITFNGETFVVQGESVRDADRLIWVVDTRVA